MNKSAKYTLRDFERQFPNDAACLAHLMDARHPHGVTCGKCQRVTKHFPIAGRKVYSCTICGNHVSPTAGTIFDHSPTPLRLWFYAMFLVASTRCGISAKQLEREIGVTYKTAWRMFRQIRSLMGDEPTDLGPTVEVDETYLGGVRKGQRGRPGALSNKVATFGIVERGGRVYAKVVPNVQTKTLAPEIWKHVPAYEGRTVYSDELASYNVLTQLGYKHETVHHGAAEYVRGPVHVNSVEGFWSLVKRGIGGVYHAISPKYAQSYVNEYSFRYSRRESPTPMFLALLARVPQQAAP